MRKMTYSLTEHSCLHVLREEDERYVISPQRQKIGDVVIHGDALRVLMALPDGSVQVVITSPPYYKQRNYNAPEQLGNESRPEEYVGNLVSVFSECKRVLKPNGLLWLNLGDKYLDSQL